MRDTDVVMLLQTKQALEEPRCVRPLLSNQSMRLLGRPLVESPLLVCGYNQRPPLSTCSL